MKNNKILIKFLIIIFVISMLGILITNEELISIKSGELILKNGFDKIDNFSSIDNLKYENPHWLVDLLFGLIYKISGIIGIYILAILIYAFAFFLIYKVINKKTNDYVAFISVLIIMYFFGSDYIIQKKAVTIPDILSTILIVLQYEQIERFLETEKTKYLLMILLEGIIFANVNNLFYLIYIIMFIPYLISFAISLFIKDNSNQKIVIKKYKLKTIIKLFILIIILFFVKFINPFGSIKYSYLFEIIIGKARTLDWKFDNLIIESSLAFLCMLVINYSILIFTNVKIKIENLIYIVILSLVAMYISKALIFFVFVEGIIGSKLIYDFICENNLQIDELLELINGKIFKICFGILFIIVILQWGSVSYKNFKNAKNIKLLITYIQENIDYKKSKIFNSYELGGEFIYNNIPVFIDERYEMYTSLYNDSEIAEDYYKIYEGKENYNNIMEKYNLKYVIINKGTNLNSYIKNNSNYEKIYGNEDYVVYEKR